MPYTHLPPAPVRPLFSLAGQKIHHCFLRPLRLDGMQQWSRRVGRAVLRHVVEVLAMGIESLI